MFDSKRWKQKSVVLLVFLVVLLGAGQVWGHDFWLAPSSYQPAKGQRVSIQWLIGMGFQGKAYRRKQSRIRRFVHMQPDGRIAAVPGREKADPAGAIQVQTKGLHTLLYRSHRAYIKLSAKKFNNYLTKEGLPHIVERRRQRKEYELPGKEWYSRSAKTLFQVGNEVLPDRAFALPAGLDFELLPLRNPFRLALDQPLPFLALYKGKPLRNQVIAAYHRHQGKLIQQKGRTNARGIVFLTLSYRGPWLVKGIHMFRTPKGSKADWESVWGSLTFRRDAPASRRATSHPATRTKSPVAR